MSTIYRGYDITREPLRKKFVVRLGDENTPALYVADTEEDALRWIDAEKKRSRGGVK